MRFTAGTLAQAMAEARREAGADVHVTALEEGEGSVTVEVRAAPAAGWRQAVRALRGPVSASTHTEEHRASTERRSRLAARLEALGARRDWAGRLAAALAPQRDRAGALRETAAFLDAALRLTPPPDLAPGRSAIVLVGPTGAGKSTAACRLARRLGARARLVAGDHRSIVGAALLEAFAARSGCEIEPTRDIRALTPRPERTLIIDTAGLGLAPSEQDRDRVSAAVAATPSPAIVLVLPATFGAAQLGRAIRAYGEALPVDAVCLTHLDESAGASWEALAVLAERDVALAYIGRSASLASEIEPAAGTTLADILLEGLEPLVES